MFCIFIFFFCFYLSFLDRTRVSYAYFKLTMCLIEMLIPSSTIDSTSWLAPWTLLLYAVRKHAWNDLPVYIQALPKATVELNAWNIKLDWDLSFDFNESLRIILQFGMILQFVGTVECLLRAVSVFGRNFKLKASGVEAVCINNPWR